MAQTEMENWNMGSFSNNVPRAVLPLLLALTGVACGAEPTEESRAGAVAQADVPKITPQCSDPDGGADAGTAVVRSNPGYYYGPGWGGAYPPSYGYGGYGGYGYPYDGLGAYGPYGYGVGGYGYGPYMGGYGAYGGYGIWEPNYGIAPVAGEPQDAGSGCAP
jgi:hypothetical protein